MVQSVSPVQGDPQSTSYVFPDTLSTIIWNQDSLKATLGDKKRAPRGYETVSALAFSAYPQLADLKIDILFTQSGAPMESNFDVFTLFGKRRNRHYKILINNAPNTSFNPILLRSLPMDAQVGILAHELGHVAYYHNLNLLEIAKWGVMYLISDDFRAAHERNTDLMPVFHGLGSQIYQYAHYIRNDPSCLPMYRKYGNDFLDKYYMTDKELMKAITSHPLYLR